MYQKIKLLVLNFITNLSLLILLFICIQNSNKNNNIKFFSFKSIEMPISFIIGISFFAGSSIGGTLTTLNNNNHKNKLK